MNQVSTVGLDLAKYIFQLHGADSAGAVVFRKKLRRGQLLAFLATLPPCTVAMEACGSAHYWGREIAKLGHTVKLIAPAYVKPFVKRQKNDMADAEAICEAAQRPTMRFVRACKIVGVIRLLLAVPGHHSRAGSPDSVDGRRPRACRSARPCARQGRAARSPCSSASAAPCSCAWPRSH